MTREENLARQGNLGRLRMLAQDTAVYGIAAAINKSFALILFPLLTRLLTVEDYGRLDFALYAAALFGLLALFAGPILIIVGIGRALGATRLSVERLCWSFEDAWADREIASFESPAG